MSKSIEFFATKDLDPAKMAVAKIGRVAWVPGETEARIFCPGTGSFETPDSYKKWHSAEKAQRRQAWERSSVPVRRRRALSKSDATGYRGGAGVAGDLSPGFPWPGDRIGLVSANIVGVGCP